MIYPENYTPDLDVKAETKVEIILHLCEKLHSDICHELFREKSEITMETGLLQNAMQDLRALQKAMSICSEERRKS